MCVGGGGGAGGGRHIEKRERQVMIHIVRENFQNVPFKSNLGIVFVVQRTDKTICLVIPFCVHK